MPGVWGADSRINVRIVKISSSPARAVSNEQSTQTKKEGATSHPPLKGTAAISYLWPECVIRAKMSRRLSGTVALANSARSAGLHLLIVALMAVAHLSMPSALG